MLNGLRLPFIAGYKPRNNAQLLLRKVVLQYVLSRQELVQQVVDAMEEFKAVGEKTYRAVVVKAPKLVTVGKRGETSPRIRLPRRVDFAARNETNRRLGRAGEQWALSFEVAVIQQAVAE